MSLIRAHGGGSLVLIAAVLAAACAAPPGVARRFEAPPDAVRGAALEALSGFPNVVAEEREIRTGWLERDAPGPPQGILMDVPDRERVRIRLDIRPADGGTEVVARATIERRGPGGTPALRWQRIRSDGRIERETLDRISKALSP
jgi:hypothetical protein